MARKTKKWYVVLVGKSPGVYETWSEVAPLVSGVPGAIHESFNTVGEANRSFAQARDNGVTKVVERGADESKTRAGTPKTPLSHESVQASPSRSSPRALETPKSRRSPLRGSPSNMAEAALPLPVLHPNVTYTQGPSSSSPHVSPKAKQRTTSRSPRVTVRTPSDIPSYPSDSEEPSSPQRQISSFTSTPIETSQPMDSLSPVPDAGVSQPTSYSMKPLVLVTLSPLDSPKFFTPENMSPLASGPSMHSDHSHASLSSPESSCPKCGFIFEMKEETAPESPLDPRSPLNTLFGRQFSYEGKGRPSPDMKAQPPIGLLLST